MADVLTEESALPLCVDLDGTVLRTDLLYETLFVLVSRRPSAILRIPFWLMNGRAYLKRKIAQDANFDPATLPYNNDLIDYLKLEKGRPLILVTGSDFLAAEKVARHLGLFSRTMGSDGVVNLTRHNKADRLVKEYGEKGFDYIGDSFADIPVWARARKRIAYGPSSALTSRAGSGVQVIEKPSGNNIRWLAIKALRPHQWVKNLLIFIPLLAAHKISDLNSFIESLTAFGAFSAMASSSYLINDLLDLEADRRHQQKKSRPMAAGDFPLVWGGVLCVTVMAIGLLLGSLLPRSFFLVLIAYYTFSTSYSLWLKRMPVIDVLILAGLYTVRIIGGHEATGIRYSFWLLTFSIFLFLSLAFVKRFSELIALPVDHKSTIPGRGYEISDRSLVLVLGASSGQIAVLVLALYLNSQDVLMLYKSPKFLWALCPLLIYWISRIWFLASRGLVQHDPVVFALKDYVSYIVASLVLVCAALAVFVV